MENDVLLKELNDFGKNENIFTMGMLADFFNVRELVLVRIIEENITSFKFNVDIKEVSGQLINQKVYILSWSGTNKLKNILESDWHEVAGKFLTDYEIKELLKSINQNSYVKEFERVLRPPRGKQGAEFKKLYILPFFNKISEEVKIFLISSLEVQSLNRIPRIAYLDIIKLIRDGYTLSPELRTEFTDIHNQLMDLRQKVNEENKRNKVAWFTEYSETELKQLIRVMNRYIE